MTAVLTAAAIDVFCAGPKFTKKTKKLTASNNVKGMHGMYIGSDFIIVISSSSTFIFTTEDIRTLTCHTVHST